MNILDSSSFQGSNIDENCSFSATSSLIGSIRQSMFSEESGDETKTPSPMSTSCHQQSDIPVCTWGSNVTKILLKMKDKQVKNLESGKIRT